jgi:hypothetical protein
MSFKKIFFGSWYRWIAWSLSYQMVPRLTDNYKDTNEMLKILIGKNTKNGFFLKTLYSFSWKFSYSIGC